VRALKSELARRVLAAGIRPRVGVPFFFEGKWYTPKLVPNPYNQPKK
jgi:hypothetical protein